jgi:macrolide-specific efflux system membrane fusion protein
MTAQVAIVLTEAKQVLSIPVSALQDKGKDGRQTVKVLVAGVPQVRIIKIGFSNNVNVQVIDGLREGEIVIIGEANFPAVTAGSSRPPGPPVGR